MKIRSDIAELLRAGVPQIQIARQLHVSPLTVQQTREALGIPSHGPGARPTEQSFEDAYRARTEPVEGGHLRWTGHTQSTGTPMVGHRGSAQSAYRIAFRIRYGREPVGYAKPGCDRPGCVAPDHVEDQPMRETFEAIFGGGR